MAVVTLSRTTLQPVLKVFDFFEKHCSLALLFQPEIDLRVTYLYRDIVLSFSMTTADRRDTCRVVSSELILR